MKSKIIIAILLAVGTISVIEAYASSTSNPYRSPPYQINDTSSGSAKTRISIDSSGNVGIGTATPNELLQVGSGANQLAYFYENNGGVIPSSAFGLKLGYNYMSGAGDADFWNTWQPASTSFTFKQKTGANTFTDLLTILAGGNVGIGATSPYTHLDVAGSVTLGQDNTYPIRASDSVDSRRELLLGYYAGSETGIVQAAKTGVAWEPLSLDPNGGNVGIGTGNPVQKLEVNGNVQIDGNIQEGSAQTLKIIPSSGQAICIGSGC